MEEEEKINAIGESILDRAWEQFCLLCDYYDKKTAMQWWLFTSNAFADIPGWHYVAEGMKQNMAQQANDEIRKKQERNVSVPFPSITFNDAKISQLTGLNETGAKILLINNPNNEK